MNKLCLTHPLRKVPSIPAGLNSFKTRKLNCSASHAFSHTNQTLRPHPEGTNDVTPKRMRMLILGPPGSGKGTHCNKLLSTFNPALIGTGDLLRWNVTHQTEVGKQAEHYISRGEPDGGCAIAWSHQTDLLPDDIMLELVKPEIRKLVDRDWILDGFPRTRAQSINLDRFLKEELSDELNLIISLHVPDEVILERISGRWIHGPSGRIYNTTFNPPQVEGKDDITGDPLIKRKDDTVEVFAKRLSLFHEENEPMIDYYEHQALAAHPSQSGAKPIKKLVNLYGHSSVAIWPSIQSHVQQRFPHLKPISTRAAS